MAYIKVENLSYSYPENKEENLIDINIKIEKGDFVLIFGKSGSGKTSLIKNFKGDMLLSGKRQGNIYISGKEISQFSQRESLETISLIGQNPSEQIVTDRVWHELAFGLENLGVDQEKMRVRVSEIASYFNLEDIFNKSTYDLSGGQKQLVNLASAVVMNPEILILDEPTSSLDPISSQNFINMVKKLNEDLGITIIMVEHKLDMVLDLADKTYLMEDGRLSEFNLEDLSNISLTEDTLTLLPKYIEIFYRLGIRKNLPKTIKDARKLLKEYLENNDINKKVRTDMKVKDNKRYLLFSLKDIYFRYEIDDKDVLEGLNLDIYENEVLGIIGGNGSGKSTLVKILAKLIRPYRGSIKYRGINYKKIKDKDFYKEVNALGQEVENIFSNDSVYEELEEMTDDKNKIEKIISDFELENLLDSHPFDISDGEKQRVALGKIFLNDRKVIILDEPTRGMDSFFKEKLSKLLDKYKKDKTIVIISHDIDFISENVDRIGFLFDGEITSIGDKEEILGENLFYTTEINKITREICGDFFNDKSLLEYLGGENE